MRRSTAVLLGALLAVAIGLGGVRWWHASGSAVRSDRSGGAPASTAERAAPTPAPPDGAQPAGPRGAVEADGADLGGLPETPWANVDLEAIRKVMPDNAFWTMAVPTSDPTVVAQRDATRERWNREWGKILSGTATAEEIDAYYAERQRVAQDYAEFATYLLSEYGDALTVRDVGLLKVAVELNLARLERFPREIVEAQERRREHDAARRAWREQQRLFDDAPAR
jgi:hypothetical protein